MKVIGLTGGIASGKSVVSSMIKELGYQVIDTDLIARDLMTNNNEVISEVRTFFPDVMMMKQSKLIDTV